MPGCLNARSLQVCLERFDGIFAKGKCLLRYKSRQMVAKQLLELAALSQRVESEKIGGH
mgnify:CR=1 FL=1